MVVVPGPRGAGRGVAPAAEGAAEPLAAALDLAAFRIVQESVTNVIRHADTAHAAVRLSYGDDVLVVEVCDEGRGGTANGHGNGLAGMAERAAALGGTLDAGPRPGGGFRVHARLPRGAGPKPPGSFAPRANTPGETSPQGEASP